MPLGMDHDKRPGETPEEPVRADMGESEQTVVLECAIPIAEGDLVIVDGQPQRVQRLVPGEVQLSAPGAMTDSVMGLEEFKRELREAEHVQFVR